MAASPFHLFDVIGIEIEYMIVDRETLGVAPLADRVLAAVGPAGATEVELDGLAWSNELALHVIELKTNGPAPTLGNLTPLFQDSVRRIDAILEAHGARLMPGAMHPWMDAERDLRLWPHEAGAIYETFHRIFDCRGHGWANVQSVHVNLPFSGDEEFARLHDAIRFLLPILPALAASSPVVDGQLTRLHDTRMHYYRHHAQRVPSVVGHVVPERVATRTQYEDEVLGRIYRDLAPHDPGGVIRHEWANARGAIARFDRSTIEIRVLDVQECPHADLAIAAAVQAAVRALTEESLGAPGAQHGWSEERLEAILLDTIRDGDRAVIGDAAYGSALGYPERGPVLAADLWRHIIETTLVRPPGPQPWTDALETILGEGCLARRIQARLGEDFDQARLRQVYGELCDCLAGGRMLRADA